MNARRASAPPALREPRALGPSQRGARSAWCCAFNAVHSSASIGTAAHAPRAQLLHLRVRPVRVRQDGGEPEGARGRAGQGACGWVLPARRPPSIALPFCHCTRPLSPLLSFPLVVPSSLLPQGSCVQGTLCFMLFPHLVQAFADHATRQSENIQGNVFFDLVDTCVLRLSGGCAVCAGGPPARPRPESDLARFLPAASSACRARCAASRARSTSRWRKQLLRAVSKARPKDAGRGVSTTSAPHATRAHTDASPCLQCCDDTPTHAIRVRERQCS